MKNAEIAKILYEISMYLEMEDEIVFKVRAYEKAAQTIGSMADDVEEMYNKGGLKALEDIPGVGKSIAEKIEEYIKTGKIKFYENLRKKIPVNIGELTMVEGIGPKKIKVLYKNLQVKGLADLERAAKQGKIRKLAGFGAKTEQNILKGLEFRKQSTRSTLDTVDPVAEELEKRLKSLKGVQRVEVAGSFRRRKETIGDIDMLAISAKPKAIMEFFTSMPEVALVLGKGATKSSVRLKSGIDVDLRVLPEKSFGAALLYFTGSKDHNVALRKIAIDKGYKLNEYGLFRGKQLAAGTTEEEVYRKLGLAYIEPELRENAGEMEAAKKNRLPKLVGYDGLQGDLQVQTKWTDGTAKIEEMAKAARAAGLKYMLVTDHTKSLAMTGGLDERALEKQGKEIDAVNKKLEGITVLKGAEVNIRKDGTLDIADSALKKLDIVGIAVHSHFSMPRTEMTKRITDAMQNINADILFHPTGRLINRRNAYDADVEKIIDVAKSAGTVLEIDAYPERLDLKDEYIRKAKQAGVRMSIDSDAHSVQHFRFLKYGIAQARRGWAEKKDIINAWPLERMTKMLK